MIPHKWRMLVVAGALFGLALSIPVFDWLHATFEFMR